MDRDEQGRIAEAAEGNLNGSAPVRSAGPIGGLEGLGAAADARWRAEGTFREPRANCEIGAHNAAWPAAGDLSFEQFA